MGARIVREQFVRIEAVFELRRGRARLTGMPGLRGRHGRGVGEVWQFRTRFKIVEAGRLGRFFSDGRRFGGRGRGRGERRRHGRCGRGSGAGGGGGRRRLVLDRGALARERRRRARCGVGDADERLGFRRGFGDPVERDRHLPERQPTGSRPLLERRRGRGAGRRLLQRRQHQRQPADKARLVAAPARRTGPAPARPARRCGAGADGWTSGVDRGGPRLWLRRLVRDCGAAAACAGRAGAPPAGISSGSGGATVCCPASSPKSGGSAIVAWNSPAPPANDVPSATPAAARAVRPFGCGGSFLGRRFCFRFWNRAPVFALRRGVLRREGRLRQCHRFRPRGEIERRGGIGRPGDQRRRPRPPATGPRARPRADRRASGPSSAAPPTPRRPGRG